MLLVTHALMHKSNARNFLIRNGDTVQRSDLMDFIKFFSFLGLILASETFLIVIIFTVRKVPFEWYFLISN